jgi:uncharacterized protein YceK
MKTRRALVLGGVLVAAALSSGCGALVYRGFLRDEPRVYGGTEADLRMMTMVPAQHVAKSDSAGEAMVGILEFPLFASVFAVDGAASFVVDTVLLPTEGPRFVRYKLDCRFWDRYLQGGEEIPPVTELREHFTEDQERRLATSVSSAWRRGEKPVDWAERLDRLIEARLALVAVAGRRDILPRHVRQLYGCVLSVPGLQKALARNPATPPEFLEGLAGSMDGTRELAKNPALPAAWAERLLLTADRQVLLGLARNPGLPADLYRKLAKMDAPWISPSLASNTSIPDDVAWQLVRDPKLAAPMMEYGRADLPAELLRAAVTEESGYARRRMLHSIYRQKHAPPDLISLAWEAAPLSARDAVSMRDVPPDMLCEAIFRSVSREKQDAGFVRILLSRSGREEALKLRERAEARRSSSAATDRAQSRRCRWLVKQIDERLAAWDARDANQ